MKKEIIIIADYTEQHELSLEEICEICGIEPVLIRELIAYDIIEPAGSEPDEWVFDMVQLKRLRTALRLQHDFELNIAGTALVLQLLDEMEELRIKSELFNKHLL
ncbi:MAG TPA: chaperone modulator CbpM [Gammaproteobacteria bacterium]|jgi:chaperone modulatory protein CbpM|nr:chaperone modulator CbpM [Gammaproteobacteria bacterium]